MAKGNRNPQAGLHQNKMQAKSSSDAPPPLYGEGVSTFMLITNNGTAT